jgi:transposase
VVEAFPEEVAFVLHTLRAVFHTDAQAKQQGLSPAERLLLHQKESGPRMKALQDWMAKQFAEHTVEPHSGLGQAIAYMQNHWEKLTLFLRVPGAPLDNNITGNYSGVLRQADRLKRGDAQVLEFLLRANVQAFKRTQH